MATPFSNPPSSLPVSIALCTCNGSAFLLTQLNSIARQTRRPAELVICDDQSTDDTAAIVAAFAHHVPFPVSFNINPRKLGVTRNFERAISLCQSPLIATCDQDDIWLPEKLATMAAAFEQQPALLAAFSDMTLMTHDDRPLGRSQWQQLGFDATAVTRFNQGHALDQLLRYNVVTGMAMMFRKTLFQQACPLDSIFIHDEWMSLIAAAQGPGRILAINQPLVHYRQHPSQKIGGATRNPYRQWQHARKHMGNDYIAKQLTRTEHLWGKLASLPASDHTRQALTKVDEKIAHLQRRITLRQGMFSRILGSIRECRQGQYRRFGHGWRSHAQDLFL